MWSPHDGILKNSYSKKKKRERMKGKGRGEEREGHRRGREEEKGHKDTPMFLVSCCVLHTPHQNSAILKAITLEPQKSESKRASFPYGASLVHDNSEKQATPIYSSVRQRYKPTWACCTNCWDKHPQMLVIDVP